MADYKATNLDTHEVVTYTAVTPQTEHLSSPWKLEEVVVVSSPPEDPAPQTTKYGGRRDLTQLEFLRLFTAQERIGIRAFMVSSSPYARVVADYMQLVELADLIHLDDPDTQEGVPLLETLSLLDAGRAQVILNG